MPFGVDFYIYPVVWGGIGAAIAAAMLGPLVSLLKGWYLSFWPLLAIAIVVVSSVAGSALTDFSGTYWHGERTVATRPNESEITTARSRLSRRPAGGHRSVTLRQRILP